MVDTAPRTVVDVIESALGEELGPDLIARVDSLPYAVLFTLHETYEEFAVQTGNEINADRMGLRPYIPAARLSSRFRRGILDGTDHAFDDLGEVDASVEALQKLLLYCHSVALLNPLVYITDWIRMGSMSTAVRGRLANYLSWINYVRPLIDSGALLLLEDRQASIGSYGELPTGNASKLAERYVVEADFSDTLGLPPAEAQEEARRKIGSATAALSSAIDNVGHEWAVTADYRFAIDHFLPTRLYLTALRAFASRAAGHPIDDPYPCDRFPERKLDALRLMALLELDLPNFEFSARDLVLVREGDQFVQWRADLSRALDHIILLDDQDLLEHGRGLRILEEELVGTRRNLEKVTGRSKYLSDARAGNITFVTGGLAAMALSAWGNPAIGLASMGISTALQRALAFRKSKVRDADVALLNHYVLFTSAH